MAKLIVGMLVGVGIAYLAFRAQTLNRSGGIAAAILGTIVFGLGGVGWAVVLLSFFISSSALSKFFKTRKSDVDQNFAKGSRRDVSQVAANGGAAGLLVLAYSILFLFAPESELLPLLWLGFAASLAGANADTWATELGVLNPRQPVLVTTFRRVPQGSSGAVSIIGSVAALGGAALVAGMAVLSTIAGWAPASSLPHWLQFLVIIAGGMVGTFVDSLLGATVQSVYACPACKKETERYPVHICGTPTIRVRGLSWLNNDWVNTACTLGAGLVGLLLATMISA